MVCPHRCRVDRLTEGAKLGVCRTGRYAHVGSYFAHRGEEDCLVGRGGSGTIFFSSCNLFCKFCQNFDLSWHDCGRQIEPGTLAELMLHLQNEGCENINFVSPSHVVPQILEALPAAVEGGLRLPLVYNTGGYDSVETLELLDGVFDIYMPDLKFFDQIRATQWTEAKDYPKVVRAAIKEMHRQVGDLQLDERGVATRGLLVRYLVMPDMLEDARAILTFLAEEISKETFVNVMAQYHPAGQADQIPGLDRPTTQAEYRAALEVAAEVGLHRFG